MSEQKITSYMQEFNYMQKLNQWIKDEVIDELRFGDALDDPNARSDEDIIDQVYESIRGKILESYRDGIKAGAAKSAKDQKYPQAKTR